MDAKSARLLRIQAQWEALDEAMMTTFFQCIEADAGKPWLSSRPQVTAAWEVLTRPENLANLELWLEHFDGGASMNDSAAEATRKAIEVSRSRMADQPHDYWPFLRGALISAR